MADKTIGQLPRATTVQESDLFAIEQSGEAKGVSGYTLVADLAHYLNGRGGINNIEYTAPVSPSLTGTVTITLADGSTESFSVQNGRGITSFTSESEADQTTEYTLNYNDGSTTSFEVQDGRSIEGITKTGTVGLTDTYTITYNRGANSTFTVKNGREITSVAKTSTDGLTDNYTISFNDNTTEGFSVDNGRGISDFTSAEDTSTGTSGNGISHVYTIGYNDDSQPSVMTIRDGLKGDTGAQTYVHVAWADTGDNPPTLDTQIDTDNALPWIGICEDTVSTDPRPVGNYTWYKYKGATGDTGASIDTIEEDQSQSSGLTHVYEITLTNGNTATFSVNDGVGISSITPPGNPGLPGQTDTYQINLTNGNSSSFDVYNGTNGTGSVSTVSGISPVDNDVPQIIANAGAPGPSTPGVEKQLCWDTQGKSMYYCEGESGGTYSWRGVSVAMTVDSSLSTTSTNPIQNATITNRVGTAALPNSSSDLTAAVNYVNGRIPSASSSTPLADASTGSAGSSTAWAKGDHTHPFNVPSTGTPADLGVANLGSATTYARSDHVHKRPTPAELGAVSTADENYKIYDTVADLTLNDTALVPQSASISDAWTALPAYSMLICDCSDFASGQTPTSYGTVAIVKATNASDTYAYFYGKQSTDGTYRMYSTNAGGASNTWTKVVESNDTKSLAPAAFCGTAAATAAKTATCAGYVLAAKTWLQVLIATANTSASALTLSVNGQTAKPIYINGAASSSTNYTLPAGSYFVYYDGTNYQFRTDGILPNVPYGTQINVTSGTADLNNYTTPGLYYFKYGVTMTNVPNSATNGWLYVLNMDNNGAVKQIWFRHGSNPETFKEIYQRLYASSAWGSWSKIAVDVDFKIYKNVTDLGFEEGAAATTIKNVYAAMPACSILITQANARFPNSELPPSPYGSVEIVKISEYRGWVNYYGKEAEQANYRMYLVPNAQGSGPTGVWVKWLTGDDVNYTVYDSVTKLGLTSGSATIAGAFSAMDSRTILVANGDDFSSGERPTTACVIQMVKHSSLRGYILAFGKESNGADWRMYVDSNGAATGTWYKVVTSNNASSTSPKAPGTAAAGTSTDYARADHVHPNPTLVVEKKNPSVGSIASSAAVDKTLSISKSGYTALGVVGHKISGSGSSQVTMHVCYISGTTLYTSFRNFGGSATSPTVDIYVLYLKN